MSEEWRPVVGFEGLYEVSDHGRVRSLGRVITDKRGWNYRRRPRLLSPGRLKSGHLCVRLYAIDGTARTYRVHELVLVSFVCPRPDGLEACHYDGDPANNHRSNLRWDTRSANIFDQVRHGTHISNQLRGKKRARKRDTTTTTERITAA